MALSINWSNKVITVPQADLTPLGGSSYSLDTMGLKIALRDIEDSEPGVSALPILDYVTSKTLGGIGYAPLIEIINGYTITFQDTGTPYRVFVTASNNNVLDVTNLNNVSVAPNNSAGLVQMTEIQHGSFNGVVTVDAVNGALGTTYPNGTTRVPVKLLADAKTIAVARGFTTIQVIGDITIDDAIDFTGFTFIGGGIGISHFTVMSDATVFNCEFQAADIIGTLDGQCRIRDCAVTNLNYVTGVISDSILESGVIQLSAGGILFPELLCGSA